MLDVTNILQKGISMNVRRQIFKIIDIGREERRLSIIYDRCMIVVIVISVVPLALKQQTMYSSFIDKGTAIIFIIDYILRWYTADFRKNPAKKNKKIDWKAIIFYPIEFYSIMDVLAILPVFFPINQAFKVLKLCRIVKLFHYTKSFDRIMNVIQKEKHSLMSVAFMAFIYIVTSALIMFSVEPESFEDFFEAIYWATTALTTVGYGDIYPVTRVGRVVSMISSLLGIAFVALPSGIITAGFLDELKRNEEKS